MKKFISLLVVAAFALSMVPAAHAATVEELTALIAQLQQQIAGLSGTTSTGTCQFSTNLKLGMRTDDVKLMQEKLSVSNTGYFGPLTLAAVKTFQAANGVPATGFVGALTRAALNSKYCTVTTPITVPGVVYPAGCTSSVGFSSTTGLSCSVAYPAGCTSATGYSITTGLSCATGTPVSTTTEGSIAVTAAPIATLSQVYGGDIEDTVYVFNVKASSSDMILKKVDVEVYSAVTHFPWRSYTSFSLFDGATKLATVASAQGSLIENTFGSSYIARFDGLSLLIAKDATKTLTVKADVMGNPLDTTALKFGLWGTNAVRATDSLGLNQYGTYNGTNTPTIATSNAATITLATNVKTPVSNNVLIDATNTTSDVDLLHFDIKAKNNNVTINNIVATVTGNTLFSAVKLYDGATLLSVQSPATTTTAAVTFSNLSLAIAKDATKTLTIKVDVKGGSTGTYRVDSVQANGTDTQYNSVSGSTTNPTYAMTGVVAGPVFTKVSTSTNTIAPTSGVSGTVSGTIVFTVKANGADITKYDNVSNTITVEAVNASNATSTVDETLITMSPDTIITDGNTATITVTAKKLTSAPTTYKFRIASILTGDTTIHYSATGTLANFVTGWSN